MSRARPSVFGTASAFEAAGLRGRTVFVPTMGALHAGHADLIRRAAALARDRGVDGASVSIFVNPTQFNDPADFSRYPRTLEHDLTLCADAGALAVYAPDVGDVYPDGPPRPPTPVPDVGRLPGLEDRFRPAHFAGVCEVVRLLFERIRPVAAVFGEKDWQQLQVVAAMTAELGLGVEIVPAPTVREPDGLAMSSRNRFLTPDGRRRGLAIPRALRAALEEPTPEAAERRMAGVLAEEGLVAEYAVVRDARTLLTPGPAADGPWRALITAPVGSVRLLDNAPWSPA